MKCSFNNSRDISSLHFNFHIIVSYRCDLFIPS
nr:MAG TPA: hypothetical protein [Caudoviricetes sp.]